MRLAQFENCGVCEERRSDFIAYDQEKHVALGLCDGCLTAAMGNEETDWRYTDVETHE